MKVFTINLNNENPNAENFKELRIVPLADLHIGDELLDMKALKEAIEYIRDNENVYTVLNGDLMNTAIKSSISDVYNETMTPMQQIDELVRILYPIKDKILVATSGNHERRIERDTSIDILNIAMKELGLGHRYTNDAFYLFLYFGKKEQGRQAPMVYTIYSKHGTGNGRKIGSKMNRLVEMSETCYADVQLMSHVHTQAGTRDRMYLPDYSNKSLNIKETVYAISNSFLNFGGYSEKCGYKPVSTDYIEIILNGSKRKAKVVI
jgi:hypothetical protein